MYAGEMKIVEGAGEENEHLYVRGVDGLWRPVDLGGPGYLTDRSMEKAEIEGRATAHGLGHS